MPVPTRPTAPDKALRSDPDNFSANAELAINYQWDTYPDWLEDVATFVESNAALVTGGPFDFSGKAYGTMRVNAGETALEFVTADSIVDQITTGYISGAKLKADNAAIEWLRVLLVANGPLEVGSYMHGINTASNPNHGDHVAGSNITPTAGVTSISGVPWSSFSINWGATPGTWRCHGSESSGYGGTLYQRVA